MHICTAYGISPILARTSESCPLVVRRATKGSLHNNVLLRTYTVGFKESGKGLQHVFKWQKGHVCLRDVICLVLLLIFDVSWIVNELRRLTKGFTRTRRSRGSYPPIQKDRITRFAAWPV